MHVPGAQQAGNLLLLAAATACLPSRGMLGALTLIQPLTSCQ
jgi:hypothetical protein